MTAAYRAPSHGHPGHLGMGYPAYVDPKPPRGYQAPAQDEPSTSRRPGASAFPRLDEDLVRPETREELVRGRLVLAPPAKEPHAERHFELDYLTRGVLAPGYVGATDLLTRAGKRSQFATDTCVRREGIDPATGTRHLEELAFEVVGEQSLRDITERAEDLTARGVRRVLAIFVKRGEIREWSPTLGDWITLDPSGTFEDRTIVQPIPVRALLDRAAANRAVVRALYATQEPAIMEIKEEGMARGREEGVAQGREEGVLEGRAQMARTAIEALCEVLEIPCGPERRALLHTLEVAKLEALLDRIRTERRWP